MTSNIHFVPSRPGCCFKSKAKVCVKRGHVKEACPPIGVAIAGNEEGMDDRHSEHYGSKWVKAERQRLANSPTHKDCDWQHEDSNL